MQFESYAFYKISQVIGTSDDIRVWAGGRTAYGNRPTMGVACGSRFSLLPSEDTGCVPVDNRAMDA